MHKSCHGLFTPVSQKSSIFPVICLLLHPPDSGASHTGIAMTVEKKKLRTDRVVAGFSLTYVTTAARKRIVKTATDKTYGMYARTHLSMTIAYHGRTRCYSGIDPAITLKCLLPLSLFLVLRFALSIHTGLRKLERNSP